MMNFNIPDTEIPRIELLSKSRGEPVETLLPFIFSRGLSDVERLTTEKTAKEIGIQVMEEYRGILRDLA